MNLPARLPATFHASPLPSHHWQELNRSQQGIEGFDLAAHQAARALLIGAGGIGSHVAAALIRKGLARLDVCDDDCVETKNLTRQLFDRNAIGQFKAIALARQLARDALFPAEIRGLPLRFQEILQSSDPLPRYDFVVCGVDNNATRRAAAVFGLRHKVPVILAAVSHDGNALYVMVQQSKPDTACWGCAFPQYLNDLTFPCGLPGIVDILQVVAGVIVYAVDTILGARHREWNVRHFYLDAGMPERVLTLPHRPGCALCTGHNIWAA